jgi:hypothetical protein
MPSTYSPLLRLELMAIGEKTNTWGTTNNTNLGTLIEKGIAGAATIDVTAGNVTLTALNGADDEARAAVLLVVGSMGPGETRGVVAPSTSKVYAVRNGANGPVAIKGAATTGVELYSGEYAIVGWNGSDFIRFGVSSASPIFTGIPIAPTAVGSTNTTQIATTAFVKSQGYQVLPAYPLSGTYTPAAGNLVNVAVAPTKAQWMRVDNIVAVSGGAALVLTTPSTESSFTLSLPVVSAIGHYYDVGGNATPAHTYITAAEFGQGIGVYGDPTNDAALFGWKCGSLVGGPGVFNITYQYQYEVI